MTTDDRPASPARELLSEQEERQLVAAALIPASGVLTEEQRQKVRDAADAYRKEHGLKNADIARGIGDGSPGLWSGVIAGSYTKVSAAKLDDLLRTLNNWLEEDARRRRTRPGRPFVYTGVANAMIDAAKIARTALQNAGGLAGLLLTTETLVTEFKEEDEEAPAPEGVVR